MARRQLDRAAAHAVLDDEFAAIVVRWVVEEERERQVGSYMLRGGRMGADGVVHVIAEGIGFVAVAVEQRRIDTLGQGSAEEGGILRQGFEDERAQLLRHW